MRVSPHLFSYTPTWYWAHMYLTDIRAHLTLKNQSVLVATVCHITFKMLQYKPNCHSLDEIRFSKYFKIRHREIKLETIRINCVFKINNHTTWTSNKPTILNLLHLQAYLLFCAKKENTNRNTAGTPDLWPQYQKATGTEGRNALEETYYCSLCLFLPKPGLSLS